ncbi:MAG: AraC family transcriptional regulator [Sutterellaceae bacterium]|nr:AraC family transcriptional regulator [Sutterellaceae bacterium]
MRTPNDWMQGNDTDAQVFVSDYESSESEMDRLVRLSLAEKVRTIVQSDTLSAAPIAGLNLSYLESSRQLKNCFYHLSVALILKGHKRLLMGAKEYRYGPGSCIVTSMDMPTSYELINVSKDEPFVSLSLKLNTAILAELLSDETANGAGAGVFSVAPSSREMTEDFSRLLSLLERPEQIPIRAPLIIRDIHYLALTSPNGDCLRALYAPSASEKRIRKAVHWLRENFRSDISIEALAEIASMAPTTFHRHFQEFTGFTPLQYQKRMRLYEAQQLIMNGETDAGSAAYAVGYQSVSQFSREYKRLFGEPPGRHVKGKLLAMDEQTQREKNVTIN